ncbi:MAG: hypothetical protein ACP5VE_00920 [Chthonomonadales bacterium]
MEHHPSGTSGNKPLHGMPLDLPRSLAGIVAFFQSTCPNRIFVLPEAFASARTWDRRHGALSLADADRAWQLVYSVAGPLWHLAFTEGSASLEDEFRNRTGLTLALTESKSSKRIAAAVCQRLRTYAGQTIDISPHVKCRLARNQNVRLHFWLDHAGKLVVIGHCGEHLLTSEQHHGLRSERLHSSGALANRTGSAG